MGKTKSSGANFIDRAGMRFGRWLVVHRANTGRHVKWLCRCDCGTERAVSGTDLQSGKSASCGCVKRERAGMTLRKLRTREYNAWNGMKQRCYYEKHVEFHRYGGRGITICDEWKSDFDTFLSDMGLCPEGMSLDRIDTDGPYSPSNCRWATKMEQSANTSKNVYVAHGGRDWTLKQLAEHLNINYYRLHAYFRRRGLSLEAAIAKAQEPGINRPYRHRPVTA